MKKAWLPRTAAGQIAVQLVRRYYLHDVGRDSAALTYYLLFALFPLLVFISTLLGILKLDVDSVTQVLSQIVPADVMSVLESYLEYVSANASRQLLWFSLVFSIWFPMRATSCLLHSLRKAFNMGPPRKMLLNQLAILLFTVWLILSIGLTLLLVTVGRRALEFVSGLIALPQGFIVELSALHRSGRGDVPDADGAVYAGPRPAPSPEGSCSRGRHLSGGMDGPVPGVFLLCGAFCQLLRAVRLHRHDSRGAAVAVYERHGADHGRGIQRRYPAPQAQPAAVGQRRGASMKIIIVGNGKVGYAIARQLAVEDHDITIVDDDAAALHRADSTLDVMCVEGNGASISVLDAAGVRGADLVIAVTNLDETNLVCCLIAKKLGAKHTIARVRNPEYRRDDTMLKREIGLDMLINPDLGAAQEIARILSFPAAFSVEPFAGGRIDMIGFQVTEQDTLAGVSLNDFHRNRLAEVLICAAHRGDNFIIPDGSFVPRSGDKLYMVGTKAELQKMLRGIGRTLQRVKNVSILGGSRITMYLTWELARSNTKVRIVEMKHDKCLRLSASLPGAMIIEGDGTDADLIDSENIFETDAFVALTDRDEENLLMALTAQRAGVPKVLAKMTRPNYMDLVQETKLGSIISPKDLTSNQITRYVRALANSQGSTVESLYKMLDGSVEALEFTATASSRSVLDKPLKDLALKKGVLLAAIARENKIIIPGGLTTIQEGDHVVVVTKSQVFVNLSDILA